jgi:hypothetical protein
MASCKEPKAARAFVGGAVAGDGALAAAAADWRNAHRAG